MLPRTALVREMKATGELPDYTTLRSSKYLNNLIEQDHCSVKLRIGPMLGFRLLLGTATITIAGIELLRRIQKGQFNLGRLRLEEEGRLISVMRRLQRPK